MPYEDTFDKIYLTDGYSTPDYPLATFFDTDTFFDLPVTPIDISTAYSARPSANSSDVTLHAPSTSAPDHQVAAAVEPAHISIPYEPSEQNPYGSFGTQYDSEPTPFSPSTHTSSRTPSLYGDMNQHRHSPSLSPHPTKLSSPSYPPSPPPKRKRGRPRLTRSATDNSANASSASSAKPRRPCRLPHNQVERKYREGLNSELERLRHAIPIQVGDVHAQLSKPSKATVLANAIEYIRRVEEERDKLKGENERLRERWVGGSSRELEKWEGRDEGLGDVVISP